MDADWERAALNKYTPSESKCRFSNVSRWLPPEKEQGVIENSIWMIPCPVRSSVISGMLDAVSFNWVSRSSSRTVKSRFSISA